MKRIIVSLMLCLLMVASALCETSLWVVKTDSTETYIGGAIHTLHRTDFPFPPEFDQAYNASKTLIIEADIAQLNSPEFMQSVMAKATYSDSITLDNVISADAYKKLEDYCTAGGLPIASMKQMKPWMIIMTLEAMGLQKLGVDQEGVDTYYYGKAIAGKKPVIGLETLEELVDMLSTSGEGNESEFIAYHIDDLNELNEKFKAQVTAWKSGNETALFDLFIKDTKKQFPKLYQSILVDRNMNWVPKIEEYLLTPETELVLVGVAHLVGDEGVIAQLKKLGYKVEKFK